MIVVVVQIRYVELLLSLHQLTLFELVQLGCKEGGQILVLTLVHPYGILFGLEVVILVPQDIVVVVLFGYLALQL